MVNNAADQIIVRNAEKKLLKDILNSTRSEFVALWGRRRVGKTYLIKAFFKQADCLFFHVTGSNDDPINTQIKRFVTEIGTKFYNGAELKPPKTWEEVLEQLTKAMLTVPKGKKVVLFFDEFPWLATQKSGLLQALDYYWNRFWVDNNRLKLIICGSSASWIIKNIVNNKGGLHNRITQLIELKPLSLNDTKIYLHHFGVTLNNKQILQIYMAMGGIPHYLNSIKKGLSATQNIDQICFRENGILFKEFDNLYSSLFNHHEIYIDLIKIIAKHHYGISQEEIIKQYKKASRGGRIVRRLKDLEESGFVISFIPYKHKQKGIYYRIFDEYTLFHLDWIEPITKTIQKLERREGYWESKSNTAAWKVWCGYAFESICYKHIANIRKALKINLAAEVGSWRYSSKKYTYEEGAQIDLLFDRPDGIINLCEIKYTDLPFVIDKQCRQNLVRKAEIFRRYTKIDKQIFFTFIAANGIKPNLYSEELVANVVTLEDFFG